MNRIHRVHNKKIQVKGLKKSFGTTVVLDNLNLEIEAGESFVIIGGSGTGKSVLIKCILGLIKPDAGQILIDGVDINTVDRTERQRVFSKITMLFQGGALFDSLSVWRNIAFPLINGPHKTPLREAKERAYEKLEAVNLTAEVGERFPSELSGGMQKRVALARALISNPEIIFFDEPTTGLDPIVSSVINNLIIDKVRSLKATAITITHDLKSLRSIADKVGLIYKGGIVWTGSVQEMDETTNPYVHQFINGNPEGPFTQDFKA